MRNSSKVLVRPYEYGPDQDSFIAINQQRIVVSRCPADSDVALWMEKHINHHFLITSATQALSMIGKPLPEDEINVMLL